MVNVIGLGRVPPTVPVNVGVLLESEIVPDVGAGVGVGVGVGEGGGIVPEEASKRSVLPLASMEL